MERERTSAAAGNVDEGERLLDSVVGSAGSAELTAFRERLSETWAQDPFSLAKELWCRCKEQPSELTLDRALTVSFLFDLDAAFLQEVMWAFHGDWHTRHEELVFCVARDPRPEFAGDMLLAATWLPAYMEWEKGRAMSRKAIHILEDLRGTGLSRPWNS